MRTTFLYILFLLFTAPQAHAVFTIDTTIPRVTGNPANWVDLTSASFTPPSNSLLLLFINADSTGTYNVFMNVRSSTGLGWIKIQEANLASVGQDGYTSVWMATVETAAAMTVSVRRVGTGGTDRVSFKVYAITGHDRLQPIGNSGKGGSSTNSINAAAYTSSVNNSRAFGSMNDWSAAGTMTSTDLNESEHYVGQASVISVYKSADTATAGTAVTLNFDAFGGGAVNSTWVAVEVRPDSTAGCTSPTGVHGEIKWDTVSKIKYCSSGAWRDTTHTTGASCVGTPTGTINYNSGDLRFCNATNWISMKGSYMSSCSGTTAGTYNFSNYRYRYCDGTDWYQTGPSTILYRQSKEAVTTVNSNNVATGAHALAVGQKNLLLCWIFYESSTASITGVADNFGNTYVKAVGPQTGSGALATWRQEIWYAANVTGGASLNTTATFSSTFNAYKNISCHEYSGAALTSPVDQTLQSAGTSANPTSANVTTTSASQLLFAAAAYNGGSIIPGNVNFNVRSTLSGSGAQDRPAPTAGAYNAAFEALSDAWIISIVTIRPQ